MVSVSSVVTDVRSRPQLAGYYAVMSFIVAVFSALWLFEGYYLFTAWFPSLFDEITPINGVAAGAFMTLMLACAVAALVRPTSAIGPSKVLVVGAGLLGLLMPLAFVLSEPLATVVLLAVAVSILSLVVFLHPARSELSPRPLELDHRLLGLTLLVAVPFLWLAADLQWSQLTLDDEVAGRWFYGGLSMYLLAVLSLATVATVDVDTRRFSAASAIFLAGVLGLVSVVYPTELHSLGTLGGGLLLAWCVGVAVVLVKE